MGSIKSSVERLFSDTSLLTQSLLRTLLNLNLGYLLENPLAYGCFVGSGDAATYTKTNSENVEYTQKSCEEDTKSWKSGVPTDINLKFPGENKFRTTIGARIRVLFMDMYLDYNTGTSNAINAGIGITFR